MKKHNMPNIYKSSKERNAHIINNATYHTVIRFLGTGKYERHKAEKQQDACELAIKLCAENNASYLIYAVGPQELSALVATVKPKVGLQLVKE